MRKDDHKLRNCLRATCNTVNAKPHRNSAALRLRTVVVEHFRPPSACASSNFIQVLLSHCIKGRRVLRRRKASTRFRHHSNRNLPASDATTHASSAAASAAAAAQLTLPHFVVVVGGDAGVNLSFLQCLLARRRRRPASSQLLPRRRRLDDRLQGRNGAPSDLRAEQMKCK